MRWWANAPPLRQTRVRSPLVASAPLLIVKVVGNLIFQRMGDAYRAGCGVGAADSDVAAGVDCVGGVVDGETLRGTAEVDARRARELLLVAPKLPISGERWVIDLDALHLGAAGSGEDPARGSPLVAGGRAANQHEQALASLCRGRRRMG
jgi:hypothetical protein